MDGGGWGPGTLRVQEQAGGDRSRAGSKTAGDDEERLLYKIKRGCPILGHKDRTHPTNSPIREAHPGAALDLPLQPEGDPAPFQTPWGPGKAGAVPPGRGGRVDRTPWPQHHPGSSSLVPVILPPPHPQNFPTADSGTPDISTQQIQARAAGGCSSRSEGSRRPCTSSPASSQEAGRAQPGWPHQTQSSGPAGSGLSTPGT